jgi:signal transduction histidine kinase
MVQFPSAVSDYLKRLALDHRAPAFLLAGGDGRLLASGGALRHYGLVDLIPNEPVVEQVFFLTGLLPLETDEPVVRDCVQPAGSPPIDLHLFRSEEGDWVVLLDASEAEQKQRAIQQKGYDASLSYERLVKETQKKEILLHTIVHDLAGPLMGIRGGFELLGTENLSEQGRELLDIGLRQATRQETLIREILQAFAAEVEQAQAFSADSATAPDALIAARDVAALLSPAYEQKHVRLQVDPGIEDGAYWKVVGERSRLERVFSNLIENALRHSPPNTIVTVGLQADGDQVLATIDDEGSGVPPDVAAQLFQKFAQGKGKAGKIGLGLYFCRITVEHWGGTIGQEGRTPTGSRFWFRLPRPTA